jgi:hypothetical protein
MVNKYITIYVMSFTCIVFAQKNIKRAALSNSVTNAHVVKKGHFKVQQSVGYIGIVGLKELEAYFGDFHNVYMVTKLYYGTVELTVEDEHELFFEHMIPKDLSYVALNNHPIRGNVYSFKHNNIPFACKLEPLSAKLEAQSAST